MVLEFHELEFHQKFFGNFEGYLAVVYYKIFCKRVEFGS